MHYELEDFPVGSTALTPTGRRAVVIKHEKGQSKYDCFSRVKLRYEGGGPKDIVTLQPQQLKPAPAPVIPKAEPCGQLMLELA